MLCSHHSIAQTIIFIVELGQRQEMIGQFHNLLCNICRRYVKWSAATRRVGEVDCLKYDSFFGCTIINLSCREICYDNCVVAMFFMVIYIFFTK